MAGDAAVRVGVVGAGALGYHHVRLLRDVPGAKMIGFHDADAGRAARVSAELGVPHVSSLEALLDATDAVTIVVPTTAHHAVAREALSRGVHVLIEKANTVSLADAVELLHLDGHEGVLILLLHFLRV